MRSRPQLGPELAAASSSLQQPPAPLAASTHTIWIQQDTDLMLSYDHDATLSLVCVLMWKVCRNCSLYLSFVQCLEDSSAPGGLLDHFSCSAQSSAHLSSQESGARPQSSVRARPLLGPEWADTEEWGQWEAWGGQRPLTTDTRSQHLLTSDNGALLLRVRWVLRDIVTWCFVTSECNRGQWMKRHSWVSSALLSGLESDIIPRASGRMVTTCPLVIIWCQCQ